MPRPVAAERICQIPAVRGSKPPVLGVPVCILLLADVTIGHHLLVKGILPHDYNRPVVVVFRQLLILAHVRILMLID